MKLIGCCAITTPTTKLRREYTIGQVSDWSLADAWDEAAKLRLAIKRDGVDPVQVRLKINRNPFKTLNDLFEDYHQLRKREITSHEKERSLYEREIAGRIGHLELDKIRPLDISEILRDITNGYGGKPPRPTISNDVMRMLKRTFDHGMKLDVTRFNPASPPQRCRWARAGCQLSNDRTGGDRVFHQASCDPGPVQS